MLLFSTKTQILVMLKQKEFRVSFLVSVFYACASFLYVLYSTFSQDTSVIFDSSQFICYANISFLWGYFKAIFPFLIVLPFATSYINDYNHHLIPVYLSRTSRSSYFLSKLIACFIGTAAVILIPFLLNFLLCNIFLPHNTNFDFGAYQLTNYFRDLLGTNLMYETPYPELPFLDVYFFSPQVYNLMYLFFLAGFSGLLGAFILSISFFLPKSRLFLFVPVFLMQQVLQIYDSKVLDNAIQYGGVYINWDLLDYVIPSTFKGKSPYLMGAAILILIAFIASAHCYATRKDLRSLQ